MDRKKQDLTLGAVFFASLATLLLATFYLSDVGALFRARPELSVEFDGVGGLSRGNSVYVKGLRVGEVTGLDYQPETRKVRVTLAMQEQVTLYEGYSVEIKDGSFLGGKQIEINPGNTDTEIAPNTVLAGVNRGGPLDFLGGVRQGDVTEIVADIKEFTGNLNNPDSTVYRLFNEADLYESFQSAVARVTEVVERVQTGPGPAHTIVYDENAADQLKQIVSDVREITADLRDPNAGIVGALINDESLLAQLRKIASDLEATTGDLRSDEGLIAALLRDPELNENVATAVSEFRELGELLTDPEAGMAGRIIADAELGTQFQSIVDYVEDIVQNVSEGNGLLARLINDQDLGEQFGRILNQVSRAIEDAREAAPVGTFFSVVTGIF